MRKSYSRSLVAVGALVDPGFGGARKPPCLPTRYLRFGRSQCEVSFGIDSTVTARSRKRLVSWGRIRETR